MAPNSSKIDISKFDNVDPDDSDSDTSYEMEGYPDAVNQDANTWTSSLSSWMPRLSRSQPSHPSALDGDMQAKSAWVESANMTTGDSDVESVTSNKSGLNELTKDENFISGTLTSTQEDGSNEDFQDLMLDVEIQQVEEEFQAHSERILNILSSTRGADKERLYREISGQLQKHSREIAAMFGDDISAYEKQLQSYDDELRCLKERYKAGYQTSRTQIYGISRKLKETTNKYEEMIRKVILIDKDRMRGLKHEAKMHIRQLSAKNAVRDQVQKEEIKGLTALLDEANKRDEMKTRELLEAEERMTVVQAENQRLNEELATATERVRDAELDESLLKAKLIAAQESSYSARTNLSRVIARNEILEKRNSAAKSKIVRLEDSLNDQRKEKETISYLVSRMEEINSQRSLHYKQLASKVERIKSDIEAQHVGPGLASTEKKTIQEESKGAEPGVSTQDTAELGYEKDSSILDAESSKLKTTCTPIADDNLPILAQTSKTSSSSDENKASSTEKEKLRLVFESVEQDIEFRIFPILETFKNDMDKMEESHSLTNVSNTVVKLAVGLLPKHYEAFSPFLDDKPYTTVTSTASPKEKAKATMVEFMQTHFTDIFDSINATGKAIKVLKSAYSAAVEQVSSLEERVTAQGKEKAKFLDRMAFFISANADLKMRLHEKELAFKGLEEQSLEKYTALAKRLESREAELEEQRKRSEEAEGMVGVLEMESASANDRFRKFKERAQKEYGELLSRSWAAGSPSGELFRGYGFSEGK